MVEDKNRPGNKAEKVSSATRVIVKRRERGEADKIEVSLETKTATPDGETLPAGLAVDDSVELLPTVESGRYAIEVEIARGGMGRILSARDRQLGRPVAIKQMLDAAPELERRFEREVRLTARLQHPGIISVVEAGRWAGGGPFYTMRHVQGRPLDKVIAESRTLEERLALLPNIIAVADALAYAHSERVIHRDLKPANVLVGSFGETVVIDWGLAKDLSAEDDDAGESSAAARRSSADGVTVMGSAMGTPAYMPPEQARGEAVDERADVYALGAMLYHTLTGEPPYFESRDGDETLELVLSQPAASLRGIEPEAPLDLVTLVEKAMAREPGDRYPSAQEVAEELRRFETGQLVGAHSYSAMALFGRWVRRHRASVIVAASALLVLIVIGAAAVQRIRRESATAISQRHRAEANRAEVEGLMEFMLFDLKDRLEPVGRLELLELVARRTADYYAGRSAEDETPEATRKRALSLDVIGDVLLARGDIDAAGKQYAAAKIAREQLSARAPEQAQWQLDLATSHEKLGDCLEAQGELADSLEQHRAALKIRERIEVRRAGSRAERAHLARSYEKTADALEELGQLAPALDHHRTALALRLRVASERPEDLHSQREVARSHKDIGSLRRLRGDWAAALEDYRAALEIAERLTLAVPANMTWQQDLSKYQDKVGDALVAIGKPEQGLEAYRVSLAVALRMVEHDPSNADWQLRLAKAHVRVGSALFESGAPQAALREHLFGLTLAEQLVARDPKNAKWQNSLARSYMWAARSRTALGQVEVARSLFEQCAEGYAAHGSVAEDFFEGACCYARLGAVQQAFAMLGKALDAGWRDAGRLRQAADLAPLGGDSRWADLLQRVDQRQ